MRLRFFPVAALALVATPGSSLRGQPSPKPSLRGVVVDSAGRPLDAADVELVGERVRVQTRADGSFRFEGLRAARYWLLVRRIGFFPVQRSLTLAKSEAREVTVTLAAHPVELPEIVVRGQEREYQARMRDFIWRSRSAFGGRFLTADDIARNGPGELARLVVRYLPFKSYWALTQPGGWGPDPFSQADDPFNGSRFAGRARYRPECPPAVSLNGGGISAGWAVNDFEADEVEALEIYREGATLPVEYTFANRAACGLVVVWLKSYARSSRTP